MRFAVFQQIQKEKFTINTRGIFTCYLLCSTGEPCRSRVTQKAHDTKAETTQVGRLGIWCLNNSHLKDLSYLKERPFSNYSFFFSYLENRFARAAYLNELGDHIGHTAKISFTHIRNYKFRRREVGRFRCPSEFAFPSSPPRFGLSFGPPRVLNPDLVAFHGFGPQLQLIEVFIEEEFESGLGKVTDTI